MKPESCDHELSMINNNNNHIHPTPSSHFMNDLYMVKRHFNETITEHNPNHHLIPSHHQHSNNNSNTGKRLSDEMRCVKRTHDRNVHFPGSSHVPTAVRRNERERNRVKMVNQGFSTLRQHVPNGAKNKKMSKVETLRNAVDYIKQLKKLLGEGWVLELSQLFHNFLQKELSSSHLFSVIFFRFFPCEKRFSRVLKVLIFSSLSFPSFPPNSVCRSLDVSSTTSSGSSSLEECYNTSSGIEANSCSPMSSTCSPRPSLLDNVHSSPDERDMQQRREVCYSDPDHHPYNSSHDDDIIDSLKWY